MIPDDHRRPHHERRRNGQLADLAQVCIVYFEVFGRLPRSGFVERWGIAAIMEPRIFSGRYRDWTLLPRAPDSVRG